jgi:hypothetical protein
MLRLEAIMVAAIAIGAVAEPASAQDFGSITLDPGQTRSVRIIRPGDLRVCNDWNSVSAVQATIVPRDPRLLQPGECTQDRGWAINVANQGGAAAIVNYRRLCTGPFCSD